MLNLNLLSFNENKTDDRFKAILLLQFFCVCVYGKNMAFVLSLFVPHISFIRCLERAVLPEFLMI